jgi:hypothetical protein
LKSAFRRHPFLASAFVLFTLLALFFAGRFAYGVAYWSTHHNQPVASWMTVGYVAHSWHLDPRAIDATAGLPPPAGHPLTLEEIASQRGVPVEQIIAAVEDAIAKLQAEEHGNKTP